MIGTPAPKRRLSVASARAIALAAQGFDRPRPDQVTRAHVARAISRLGLLQIDAVNVLARAHYLPLFSRLGPYPPALLDGLWHGRERKLFEYWAHEASILPLASQPNFRWRMEAAQRGEGIYKSLAQFGREKKAYLAETLAELRDRGPLSASELSKAGARRGPWWGWSEGKRALEYLFWTGAVTSAERRGFERVYDLTERALPAATLAAATPKRADAQRELLLQSAQALGVATAGDLRDYFRLPTEDVRARLPDLVEAGALEPVTVEGWTQTAFLSSGARLPRRIDAAALVAPFDPSIWERQRTERLFGFSYRIEIYTPKPKRVFGYYVLPFLMGDRLVARLDLKADRAAKRLLVQAAHVEEGQSPGGVAERLAPELAAMARWLALDEVSLVCARPLAKALKTAKRQAYSSP